VWGDPTGPGEASLRRWFFDSWERAIHGREPYP
jgi:hypothetical protein